MELELELSPEEVAQLQSLATQHGMPLVDYVRNLVLDSLHEPETESVYRQQSQEIGDMEASRQLKAQELLKSWLDEANKASADEVDRANRETEELLQNLNANRVAAGERPLFPK